MIVEMIGLPNVEIRPNDRIGVTVIDEAAPIGSRMHGFLFDVFSAQQVGARLLDAVLKIKGDFAPVLPVRDISVDRHVLDDGEVVARIVIHSDDVRVPFFLDLTTFAELIAGMARVSREIDSGGRPKLS